MAITVACQMSAKATQTEDKAAKLFTVKAQLLLLHWVWYIFFFVCGWVLCLQTASCCYLGIPEFVLTQLHWLVKKVQYHPHPESQPCLKHNKHIVSLCEAKQLPLYSKEFILYVQKNELTKFRYLHRHLARQLPGLPAKTKAQIVSYTHCLITAPR